VTYYKIFKALLCKFTLCVLSLFIYTELLLGMALKTNLEYEAQADTFMSQHHVLRRFYPKSPEFWPKLKDDKPWPASALRATKHFECEQMEAVDITQFDEFMSSFKSLQLRNHLLHREISQMFCDMIDSADYLVNGFQGKTF
jgi:hypothetical protein